MALFNLIILFLNVSVFAQQKLPELMTKQALQNIRLITKDGKFTYYQRGSKSLLLSSNYSVKEILTSDQGSHFDVISTLSRKRILVILDKNFHKKHSITQPREIYWAPFGGEKMTKLGMGNAANLHLNDEWASVYSIIDRTIKFINLSNSDLDFSIKLSNRFNPFFIPQIEMINEDRVLYTDINKDGLYGLLSYNRTTKRNKLIYKVDEPYFKIDFCLNKNDLIIGHFSYDSSQKYSQILHSDISKVDLKELYLSTSNDIGNLFCPQDENLVYFVKDTSGKRKRFTSDIFSLDIKSKELKQQTKMNTVSQIINMDGMILVPSKGKYYVLRGNSKLNTLDQLKGN
jgi:hypothetical protein